MINCPNCVYADFESGKCTRLLTRLPHVCPYAEEKEKKPMLDLDTLEVGFYAKGQDGNFYRVDLPIDFSFAKTINVLTGEVHYPNNYTRLKSLSMEEMAECLEEEITRNPHCKPEKDCTNDDSCIPCWLEWLKEEVSE